MGEFLLGSVIGAIVGVFGSVMAAMLALIYGGPVLAVLGYGMAGLTLTGALLGIATGRHQ